MENGHSTAFSYSSEQAKNIIVTQSLLHDTPELLDVEPDLKKKYFDLKKLSEKEIKLHWSIVNLSDYWREGRIPRGLRVKKFPSFGLEDPDFRSRWEGILNKCSLDLILLIIEHSKREKEETQKQLEEIKSQISTIKDDQKKLPFENKLKEDLEKLTDWVRQQKVKKFKRDENDYKEGKVYRWSEQSRKGMQRRRSVSFNLTSSDEESAALSNASSRASSSDFLDESPQPARFIIKTKKQGGAGKRQGQRQKEIQEQTLTLRSKMKR